MVSRSPGRRSRRRLQGPPPRPHDTATIGAALARAAPARASAGREPPAQGRAGKGRWTAALTNRSQPSSSSAPDEAQSAAGPAGGAGREGASGGARQALRRKSELGRRLSAECRRGPGSRPAVLPFTGPRPTESRMTTSGALFPSLVPGSRGSSNKYLVEFRAGKMSLKGTTVTPDKRKGLVYIQQTDDSLIHFCWKDRTSGNVEDDLIIFPDDCEFKRVAQCPSGRVYVLKFKAGSKRLFFWMQEPKADQDEEHCRKVNECLNNPPVPGALGTSGSGGHELSALGGEGGLQSLLGNMSHSQLMQLIGPAGLGGLGGLGALTGPGLASLLGSGGPPASSSSSSSRSQSAAVTPSSTTSSARTTPAPSAPAAASATSPSPAPSSGNGTGTAASPAQPIQLSDLQSILATMSVPAGPGGGQQVDLASVLTPEIMAPILANADVQERLLPYLPSGESLPQTAEEIQNTLTSPQFQQALGMFSAALASGQLGPLMCQFGLPAEAVEAANKGDVEAFAKAMQSSASPEQEGDGKDKKDEEEDMSLD